MERGWIKLWRKTLDSPMMQLPDSHFRVAILLLAMVNYEEKKWWNGIEEIVIPAGSMAISSTNLAKQLKCGRQVIRAAIKNLSRIKFLTREPTKETTNRYFYITIVKWADYQASPTQSNQTSNQTSNQRPTRRQPDANQTPTTTKEELESKKAIIKEVKENLPAPKTERWAEFIQGIVERFEKSTGEKYSHRDLQKSFRTLKAELSNRTPDEIWAAFDKYLKTKLWFDKNGGKSIFGFTDHFAEVLTFKGDAGIFDGLIKNAQRHEAEEDYHDEQ